MLLYYSNGVVSIQAVFALKKNKKTRALVAKCFNADSFSLTELEVFPHFEQEVRNLQLQNQPFVRFMCEALRASYPQDK